MFLGDLDPDAVGDGLAYATHYEPTPIGDANRLLEAIPLRPEAATFVDLGAGMGRVLLLALARGYQRVVGVEISPALSQIATENVRAFDPKAAKGGVRIVRRDASSFRLPAGDLVVYLFNPFRAEVLTPIVERLVSHRSKEVVVAYHTPVERAAIEETNAFDVVADLGFGVVYRRALLPRSQW